MSQPARLASIRACWQTATGSDAGLAEHRNVYLGADDLELLDGRGALEVGGDQHRLSILRGQEPRELAAGGRLARALKSAQHQDRQAGLLEPDRRVDRPHQLDQLVLHDLDDLLLGTDLLDHLGPDGLLGDPRHDLLDDVVIDVGLQERRADLAQALPHIRFSQDAADAETTESGTQPFLKIVEHDRMDTQQP